MFPLTKPSHFSEQKKRLLNIFKALQNVKNKHTYEK